MILLPLGILWAGYTLVWYGFTLIQGPGLGLLDLVKPTMIAKSDQFLAQSKQAKFPTGSPENPRIITPQEAIREGDQGRIA